MFLLRLQEIHVILNFFKIIGTSMPYLLGIVDKMYNALRSSTVS